MPYVKIIHFIKFKTEIITRITALWALEYQHCMCCQQSASQLICDVCLSCIETFEEPVITGEQGEFMVKNSQSFINLRPDIARSLPKLKQHAISAIGPHNNILLGLITQFKYGKKTVLARPLANILCRQLLNNYETDELPELVLPVPIHFVKRMFRGFNQTEQLGQCISEIMGVEMSSDTVARVRYARPQAGRTGKQRRNLSNTMYNVKQPEKLKQLSHIALLDDVITTGSTMLQIIEAIKKVNPDIRIDLWCLSVSVPFSL